MFFDYNNLPDEPEELERFVTEYEEGIEGIKTGARATIVWAEPEKKAKTDYVLVYLHGFKASCGEGEPVHRNIAQEFGFNLYLSRLYKHGIENPDAFKNIEADHFLQSAVQAFHIGKKLGKKIIFMGTSTGGSLSLYLASRSEYKSSIAGLILYSPLIRFYGFRHWLLATNTGRALLKITPGRDHMLTTPSASEEEEAIWYSSYHLQGALALGEFVQNIMVKDNFAQVKCPVFAGYYYRSRKLQDKVVSVAAIRKMFEQLGTEKEKKMLVNFPGAQTHVISSRLFSASISAVERETASFLRNLLGLIGL